MGRFGNWKTPLDREGRTILVFQLYLSTNGPALITLYIMKGTPTTPCQQILLNLFAQVGTSLLL